MANAVADLRPVVLDLLLYAGDGTDITVHIKSNLTGAALDMSLYTFTASARPERSSPDSDALAFTIDATGKATGDIVITIPAAVTREMDQVMDWDMRASKSGGDPRTFFTGRITVQEDVTR